MLGIVERAPIALATDLPQVTQVARLNDLIVADEGKRQKLRRVEPLRGLRHPEHVCLRGVPDSAREEDAVAQTGERPLERLDKAIQGLLRRAPRHRRYGTVTRRNNGSMRCNSITSGVSGLSS